MSHNIIPSILNGFSEGIIIIDSNQKIQYANQNAENIIGYTLLPYNPHPAGCLEDGDIVIIADNSIGADDGDLKPQDLSEIGITDPDIKEGDILVSVGVYHNDKIKPEYKHFYAGGPSSKVVLATNYLGFDIIAEVNQFASNATISVNNTVFKMDYFRCVGNMVVIDGSDGSIKFYQDKGYSIRKESIRDILKGRSFVGKGPEMKLPDIIGNAIIDIVEPCPFIDRIQDILIGRMEQLTNQFLEINRRMMICSISAIQSDESIEGVLVKLQDASSMDTLIQDRNEIIRLAEELQNKHIELSGTDEKDPFPEFYGNTSSMKQVKYLASKAINSKANVLITGDSGTGKSRLAFEIHNAANPGLPFVEVNCASIPQALFESELFGYIGGAFTGALKTGKAGYFESANGGTLFLDEIGEIPIEVQVKLLQALQTKRIYRVGSTTPINVNIRIIAATNIDIAEAVKQGKFRQDLYYRLNVYPIRIPPLREHPNDIYIISNNVLKQICDREGIPQKQLSASSIEKILRYPWPGNVRELENIIERAVLLCDGGIIFPEYIDIGSSNIESEDAETQQNYDTPQTMKDAVETARRTAIRNAMIATNGDKNEAMKLLKLPKTTFYDYLKKYGYN